MRGATATTRKNVSAHAENKNTKSSHTVATRFFANGLHTCPCASSGFTAGSAAMCESTLNVFKWSEARGRRTRPSMSASAFYVAAPNIPTRVTIATYANLLRPPWLANAPMLTSTKEIKRQRAAANTSSHVRSRINAHTGHPRTPPKFWLSRVRGLMFSIFFAVQQVVALFMQFARARARAVRKLRQLKNLTKRLR